MRWLKGLLLGIALTLAGAAGFGLAWRMQEKRIATLRADQKIREATDAAIIAHWQKRAAEIRERIVVKYVQKQAEIREVTKEIVREVPVFVPPEADAACVIPNGFVRVHDAAAQGVLPGAPAGTDAAPSGVALSSVASTVAGNYGICHECEAQLKALQGWILAVTKTENAP